MLLFPFIEELIRVLGQQEAYQSTSIARRSQDVHDFGLVTMQMMQKYKPDDGAIGVADPSHWGDYAQLIIQFVSDIPLATSATKLRKVSQDFCKPRTTV